MTVTPNSRPGVCRLTGGSWCKSTPLMLSGTQPRREKNENHTPNMIKHLGGLHHCEDISTKIGLEPLCYGWKRLLIRGQIYQNCVFCESTWVLVPSTYDKSFLDCSLIDLPQEHLTSRTSNSIAESQIFTSWGRQSEAEGYPSWPPDLFVCDYPSDIYESDSSDQYLCFFRVETSPAAFAV